MVISRAILTLCRVICFPKCRGWSSSRIYCTLMGTQSGKKHSLLWWNNVLKKRFWSFWHACKSQLMWLNS
uniref:Uncharacterized protein n=1 Tax=Arundo donax TaxID=35708 RepID=A0A0A9GMI0_ARUDO